MKRRRVQAALYLLETGCAKNLQNLKTGYHNNIIWGAPSATPYQATGSRDVIIIS